MERLIRNIISEHNMSMDGDGDFGNLDYFNAVHTDNYDCESLGCSFACEFVKAFGDEQAENITKEEAIEGLSNRGELDDETFGNFDWYRKKSDGAIFGVPNYRTFKQKEEEK